MFSPVFLAKTETAVKTAAEGKWTAVKITPAQLLG